MPNVKREVNMFIADKTKRRIFADGDDPIEVVADNTLDGKQDAHKYVICNKELIDVTDPKTGKISKIGCVFHADIDFQNGPVKDKGINGIQNEHLLQIVADRLKFFQNEDLACKENEKALIHIKLALKWLNKRTDRRIEHGVEGTMDGD